MCTAHINLKFITSFNLFMRQIKRKFSYIERSDEIHSCLLRILMWNYHSKVNYLCVKLRAHFRVFRKKMQAVVLAVFSGPS